MSDEAVTEDRHSKGNKRSYCSDEEKDGLSPKVTTPQTRAQVRRLTPSVIAHPSPRSSRSKLKSPVTRTPEVPKSNPVRLQDPGSCTKKSRSNIPVLSEVRVTRSRCNTPVKAKAEVSVNNIKNNNSSTAKQKGARTPISTKQKCARTPLSTKQNRARTPLSTKQDAVSSAKRMDTRVSVQYTPTKSVQKSFRGNSVRNTGALKENSPKCEQTPKIPHRGRYPKGRILDCASPESKNKKSKSEHSASTNKDITVSKNGVKNAHQEKYTGQLSLEEDESHSHSQYIGLGKQKTDANDKQNSPPAVVNEEFREYCENSSSDLGVKEALALSKNVNNTSTDKSENECNDEIKKEMEKVKKRRSTIGQRRSKSFGSSKSLGSVLPLLSFEDQISNIDPGLPQTSKVGHLIDITLREAMRRLEEQFSTDDCLSDMRVDLITNSESIGGHTAYKIAGLPLEVDKCPLKKEKTCSSNPGKIAFIKKRTENLIEENKCWKRIKKERKLAWQAAEREFREAKSGETKIDDECMKKLTKLQRNILASKPNYSQYMEEVKMAHEKTFFIMKEIKDTSNIISNFTTVIQAVGDSCYSAIEEKTLGSRKNQVCKSSLNTLLTLDVL